MSTESELSISELSQKRGSVLVPPAPEAHDSKSPIAQQPEKVPTRSVVQVRTVDSADEQIKDEPLKLPFDPARLLDALLRRWYWWGGTCLLLGALAFYWSLSNVETVATADLIRREAPVVFRASESGDAYKPQEFTQATLAQLIRSPEVYRRVSQRSGSRIPAYKLEKMLSANVDRETDLVTLVYVGAEKPPVAVNLLNLFAEEIVNLTKEIQIREGNEASRFFGEKLAAVETNLMAVNHEIQAIPPELKVLDPDRQTETYLLQLSDLDVKYELARIDLEANNPVAEKLQAARDELAALLVRYTEAHPMVQDAQARIRALEGQLASGTNAPAAVQPGTSQGSTRLAYAQNRALVKQVNELSTLRQRIQEKLKSFSEKNLDYALIRNRYQSLELMRTMLLSRQREAQLYAQDAPGYYRILHPASLDRAGKKVNPKKSLVLILASALLGLGAAAGFVVVKELADTRIRTAADLERVTGLPVLATLGDLAKMTEAEQKEWAFRTWTIIKGKITENQQHSLVCGLISAEHSEGRSTWIKLLAQTAHQRGLRVLVAATRPSPDPPLHPHEKSNAPEPNALATPHVQSVVAFPFQATRQLSDPKSHAIVHIPLPGWVWNLERRQQWQSALAEWQRIENLVFLVELPPASEPEAVLLAENLPQLIWLSESGKVPGWAARKHLETLRHAGCNLVGAVMNREPQSFTRKHLFRWMGLGLLLAMLTGNGLIGAESTNQLLQTKAQPGTKTPVRADWTKRLTLGPGDILSFSFYGDTNLTKSDVVVGMDGRVSYLQAQDIVAAGLTVDELRDKFNAELSKYYRTPRVMITPVAYLSKRYYVLGRVTIKGAFLLERPITILEAITRAHGLERGELGRNAVELADLQRSFLIRGGKRVPVDFEKLFQEGDFTQNISLEPNDFLYFTKANLKEIYVLGQVRTPGITPYTENSSVMRVIAERGGFTEKAWKNRVLVIRGSLNRPESYTVNTWAILDAREADFKLQPRDIVYVADRPFLRGEDLLDLGVSAFLQSATTAWTGVNIGPIINSPFVPNL